MVNMDKEDDAEKLEVSLILNSLRNAPATYNSNSNDQAHLVQRNTVHDAGNDANYKYSKEDSGYLEQNLEIEKTQKTTNFITQTLDVNHMGRCLYPTGNINNNLHNSSSFTSNNYGGNLCVDQSLVGIQMEVNPTVVNLNAVNNNSIAHLSNNVYQDQSTSDDAGLKNIMLGCSPFQQIYNIPTSIPPYHTSNLNIHHGTNTYDSTAIKNHPSANQLNKPRSTVKTASITNHDISFNDSSNRTNFYRMASSLNILADEQQIRNDRQQLLMLQQLNGHVNSCNQVCISNPNHGTNFCGSNIQGFVDDEVLSSNYYRRGGSNGDATGSMALGIAPSTSNYADMSQNNNDTRLISQDSSDISSDSEYYQSSWQQQQQPQHNPQRQENPQSLPARKSAIANMMMSHEMDEYNTKRKPMSHSQSFIPNKFMKGMMMNGSSSEETRFHVINSKSNREREELEQLSNIVVNKNIDRQDFIMKNMTRY